MSSTDTNQPLYLGGAPDKISFHGCMKDVVINRVKLEFSEIDAEGEVSNNCPV